MGIRYLDIKILALLLMKNKMKKEKAAKLDAGGAGCGFKAVTESIDTSPLNLTGLSISFVSGAGQMQTS